MLDVHEQQIDATLRIPLDDLETASGIDLGLSPASRLRAETARLRAYLGEHVRPVSADGTWAVTAGAISVITSEQLGTGQYPVLIAHLTLVPPTTAVERAFTLHYDVVLNKVITHVAIVSVRSDWSSGRAASAREIGQVQLDTVTGEVPALRVDLGAGSEWRGFESILALGVTHISERRTRSPLSRTCADLALDRRSVVGNRDRVDDPCWSSRLEPRAQLARERNVVALGLLVIWRSARRTTTRRTDMRRGLSTRLPASLPVRESRLA